MASISSYVSRRGAAAALRGAAEGAVAAALGAGAGSLLWSGPAESRGIALGAASAWAASSLSTAWLIAARGASFKAFWWAFGGGMALRLATLVGLALWSAGREGWSQPALLLSYALGVLGLLLIEYRHIRLR